jgi:hypothetical protein
MLVELLKPRSVELARRWVAALMLAPEDEREAIVEEVERRLVHEYRSGAARSPADDEQVAASGLDRTSIDPRHELRDLAAAIKSAEHDDASDPPQQKKPPIEALSAKSSKAKRSTKAASKPRSTKASAAKANSKPRSKSTSKPAASKSKTAAPKPRRSRDER